MTNWRNEFTKAKNNSTQWWIVYGDYLNSADWKRRRQRCLQRDGYECRICGNKHELNVHHKHYTNVGAEKPNDLTTLCEPCHKPITKMLRARRVKKGHRLYDNLIESMPSLVTKENTITT